MIHCRELAPLVARVQAHGGQLARPVFSFPGGSRFHFIEPGGNELAAWSERDAL